MAVPDFQTMMLPFLQYASDSKEHNPSEMALLLADHFQLTPDERIEKVASGKQTRLINRVYWISTHFKNAKLIESTGRGTFRISARGLELLSKNPRTIDLKLLDTFPEHHAFRNKKNRKSAVEDSTHSIETKTPDELLDESYNAIREKLSDDILEKVKTCTPAFFENLVVELLVKMGYGGTREDAGQAIGRSGDGGVDGIIKEDRLGLDVIYLQAKRWEGNVSRPEIQKFAGALQGKRAKKGVFITTSDFTKEAREFAGGIDNKLILIDGLELAEYMIDFNVGTSTVNTYEIKRIDSDYFVEE